jgi:hypothetical protein
MESLSWGSTYGNFTNAQSNGISNQRSRRFAFERDSEPRAEVQRWLRYRPWQATVGRMK